VGGPGAGADGGWVPSGERFGPIWIRGLGHHPAPIARAAPGRWAGVLCTSARTATNRRAQEQTWFTSPWGRGPWAYPRGPLGALWRPRPGPPVPGRGDPPADAPARRRARAPPPCFPLRGGPPGNRAGAGTGAGGAVPGGGPGAGRSLPRGRGPPSPVRPRAPPRGGSAVRTPLPPRGGRGPGGASPLGGPRGRPRGGVSPRPGAGGAGAWASTSGGRALLGGPPLPVPPPGGGPRPPASRRGSGGRERWGASRGTRGGCLGASAARAHPPPGPGTWPPGGVAPGPFGVRGRRTRRPRGPGDAPGPPSRGRQGPAREGWRPVAGCLGREAAVRRALAREAAPPHRGARGRGGGGGRPTGPQGPRLPPIPPPPGGPRVARAGPDRGRRGGVEGPSGRCPRGRPGVRGVRASPAGAGRGSPRRPPRRSRPGRRAKPHGP